MATKKIKKSKTTKTKSAYVLGLPADMPAKDVVAKAKTDGIGLTEGHVYSIRSSAKKQGSKAKKSPAKAKVVKANATPAKGSKGSKADFVRSMPASMKAVDVVVAAKKAGITLTASYVYEVRSQNKRPAKVAKQASPKAATHTSKTVAKKTPASSSGSEQEFRKLVIALGVDRATSLLGDVRKKLELLIAGA